MPVARLRGTDQDPRTGGRSPGEGASREKIGRLEIIEARESVDSIGGLDLLKAWLLKRRHAFTQKAVNNGQPTAKATARVFGVPLLKLDAGQIFAGRRLSLTPSNWPGSPRA